MGIRRRDTDPRLIAEATAALRALRERLAGPPGPGDWLEQVAIDSAAAQRALLGPNAPLLAALDARSAATLVGDPDRLAAWTELMRVDAEARRRQGDWARAQQLERRAEELLTLATTLFEGDRPR